MESKLTKIEKTTLYLALSALALLCCADTAAAQSNTISVSATQLAFNTSTGPPANQIVTVSSVTGSVPFTVTYSSQSNWLGAFPTSGTATTDGVPVQVYATNLGSLTTGTYLGTVTVTPSGGGTPIVISASLSVGSSTGGGGATYTASPTSLSFSVPFGTASTAQSVTLTTTAAANSVTLAASASWIQLSTNTLFVSPGVNTSFNVIVSPGNLVVGPYSGTITVTPSGSNPSSLQIPVNLTVTTGATGGTGALTATVSSLTFNAATPTTSVGPQNFTINTTSNSDSVTITPNTTSGSGWLLVNNSALPSFIPSISQSNPAQVSVSVNAAGLTPGQAYTGNIAVVSPTSGTVNIPVTLNVGTVTGGNSTLTATPNPLSVSIPAGSSVAVNQTLSVTSSTSTSVTAAVTGLSWVTFNNGQYNISQPAGPGTPASFMLTVNPAGQSAGTYTGTITLTPGGGTPLTVPLSIVIGGGSTLNVTPQGLSFAYQIGTANPVPQTLAVTSSGSSLGFSVSQQSAGWLIVSPTSSATTASGGLPSNISVQVNPNNLGPGTYSGSVIITAGGAANPTQTIPVTLVVGTSPVLQIGSSGVTFNYQYGSNTQPSQQQVPVTSSGNPISFTATPSPGSGGNFVKVTPLTGTTPQTLNISVDPAVLATLGPGTYSSNITLTSPTAANNSVNIPVTLVIGNSTVLSVSQTSMNFNYEITTPAPAIQTLQVNSTGTPLSYNVTAASSNCNQAFLNASPSAGSTPGTISVQVAISGLIAGTCNGTVTITSPGAANSPLTIPVTVLVSNTPLLNVSPGAITVTTQVNNQPVNQTVSLTSTDATVPLPFNVTSTTNSGGSNWLLVGPTSGSTPNNLTVGFQTTGLPVGSYSGSITVTPTTSGVPPTVIPVTLIVTNNATASTTPASLSFTQAFNGPVPATQTLAIASTSGSLAYSATATTLSGGNWLSVSNPNGSTPGSVTVSANGSGLNQGTYSGVVTFVLPNAANTPLNVPVTLTVGPPQSLTVSPSALNFTYASGSTAPAPLTVQITSTSGALPYSVTATSTPSGLITLTPTTGTTPGSLSVGFNPSLITTLGAGSYSAVITIASTSGGTQTVAVNLTVTAPPPPSLTTLVNSASNAPGAVAPGEIVTIYGTNLGPATPLGLTLSNGLVTTSAGGTQVLFDNVAAPLIYVSANQINAIVPYEIAGRVTTNVTISRSGSTSSVLTQRVVDSSPALFSANQSGSGPGAILNGNSSFNSSSNPAAKGSVIQIFATGEGATNPVVATGSVTNAAGPYPKPVGNVSVTIGGQPATIQFFGEAPGLVSGVIQINAVIPTGVGSGPQTVVLNIGAGSNTQQTITVAVQ